MRTEEAKFILAAYRPGGADAGDPAFSDALRMAAEDPGLGAWFAQSRAHDAAVSAKLAEIQPPAGLRDSIIAGVRVGRASESRGLGWGWVAGMAVAAGLVIAVVSFRSPARPESTTAALASFAIDDMLNAKHGSTGEPAGTLVSELQTEGSRMPGASQIDLEKLKATGCRTLNFAGHDLVEVCFTRDGSEYHFYVTREQGSPAGNASNSPSFVSQARGAAAVWSDGIFDYAVASTAGVAALRRLL